MRERIRWERELTDLSLREYDSPPVWTVPARTVAAGDLIELDATKVLNARLPQAKLLRVAWRISDRKRVVAGYKNDRTSASATAVNDQDLTRAPLKFHWISAGAAEVQATLLYEMRGIKSEAQFSAAFTVVTPKVDSFDAKFDKVTVAVWPDGKRYLRFGTPADRRRGTKGASGVLWNWQVTMPKERGGFIKDMQLVKLGRTKVNLDRSKASKRRTQIYAHPDPGMRGLQLDMTEDDKSVEATYSSKGYYLPAEFPMKLDAGHSFNDDSTFDSPGINLTREDLSAGADETFDYYLLYKSDSPNAIWVPLQKASWFWKGQARLTSDGWKLSGTGGSWAKKPQSTLDFPAYSSEVTASRWTDPP